MKPTIRNKLFGGFAGVLIVMALVAGTGCYAVFTLRRSAQDAVRIGARLNSIALEIQIHNLEAQRRINALLASRSRNPDTQKGESGNQYLEEAQFEIQEMRQLASRAIKTAPEAASRLKFQKISEGLDLYERSLDAAVKTAGTAGTNVASQTAAAKYDAAANRLHEMAEDGEITGREAAQTAEEEIQTTSSRSVLLVSVFSAFGLMAGLAVSLILSRAILTPVDHLRDVADNVSLGNLNIAVRRYSDDEIGDLADSFSRMVTAVKFFKMEAEEAVQIASGIPAGAAEPAGIPRAS